MAHTLPASWWRVKLVAAAAMARQGDLETARRLGDEASRELMALGFSDAASLGEAKAQLELQAALHRAGAGTRRAATSTPPSAMQQVAGCVVIGEPISVHDGGAVTEIPPGNPQRLVGVLVANGGSVTIDQVSDALWPGDEVDVSRTRLRNVLLRLRRAVGDIVVRTGTGLRLAPGLACDLHDVRAPGHRRPRRGEGRSRARRPSSPSRPSRAGDGPLFVDFEYEEWAITARRAADQQMITLLDLLSVQAEDAGDLPVAQALAERALRLDRYTDSRYVRLAELLTLQNRVAAAMAVLDDAAAVAGRSATRPRARRSAAATNCSAGRQRVCSGRRPPTLRVRASGDPHAGTGRSRPRWARS